MLEKLTSARAQSIRRETKSVERDLYVDCNEQRVVGICEGRPGCMMPALLTTISTPPKVSSPLSKSAPTSPGAETSTLTATSPARGQYFLGDFFGVGDAADVVDDDGEAVSGQTFCDGCTDAA